MAAGSWSHGRGRRIAGWIGVCVLVATILVFLIIRVTQDVANSTTGTVPPEGDFSRRYALNPVLAYLHILPGLVYLLGAPLQVSRRVRTLHLALHRRLGRWVVLPAGVVTGVFAIAVGVVMPFGRIAEASATVVFGTWFLTALFLAFRAVRAGDIVTHRRWMLRAFAVGIGVGMIRVVVGVGEALGIGIDRSFGAAFWIAFCLMALVAELWLRTGDQPATEDDPLKPP